MLELRWRAHPEPLPAKAAVGFGVVAKRMLQDLAHQSPTQLRRLSVVASAPCQMLVLRSADGGALSNLPWTDGVAYASPAGARLWLPCAWQPCVQWRAELRPIELSVLECAACADGQVALLWPKPRLRLNMERMQPLSADLLQRLESLFVAPQQ
jgi:hypothetical protein